MLGYGDRCCSCCFVVIAVQCAVIIIGNFNNRNGLIYSELFQVFRIGFVSRKIIAVITYGVITVTGESNGCRMDLSVMAPSADAVSATCSGSYSRQVRRIKVSLVYGDRQCLIILVIFSIMYVALIEAEAYDRRFVVDFQCCSLRSRTVGGPVFRVYTYLYIVGVELVRVDIYMSGPYPADVFLWLS